MYQQQISVLFLTHNRADLLVIAVDSLRPTLASLHEGSYEIVISDDASDAHNSDIIGGINAVKIIRSEQNMGLSHNHNKGLRSCSRDVILSIQDDWRFIGDSKAIEAALLVLNSNPEIGVVNFLPPADVIEHERRTLADGTSYLIFENDHMERPRPAGRRPYSDRPHLKRREFIDDLGKYREELPMTLAELDFQQRVACQSRWRIAYLCNTRVFEHLGAERSFNPGQHRARALARSYAIPIVGPLFRGVRMIARTIRNRIIGWH